MTALARPLKDAPVRRCATPGCRYLGGCGITRLFCPDCAARLESVRDELERLLQRKYRIFGTDSRFDDTGREVVWSAED